MFAANRYRIRLATDDDATSLQRLAELDSGVRLEGPVLIGELEGSPAAAMSLDAGRVVADASRRTGDLVSNMRVRRDALRAYEAMPSLRERMLAALPAVYRARSVTAPGAASSNGHVEDVREPVLVSN